MSMTNVSRRSFVQGSALAGTAIAGTALAGPGIAVTTAQAVQANDYVIHQDDAVAFYRAQKPEPVPAEDIAEVLDFDIVIVGAGAGGPAAALTAVEEGAKTLLIDKGDGPFLASSWIGGLGTSYYTDLGYEFDKNEYVNDLMWHADYRASQRVIRTWAFESGEAIDWYCDRATADGEVSIVIETAVKDTGGKHVSPMIVHCPVKGEVTEMGPNQTGVAYAGWKLIDTAVEAGLDFRTHTKALQLVQDETGKVTGVVAEDEEGKLYQFNAAKGVIVCTGGYSANPEMQALRYPVMMDSGDISGVPGFWSTGDGIKMALWAGAAMQPYPTWMGADRCPVKSKMLWNPGSQPWLRVDVFGRRFMNEDTPYDFCIETATLLPGRCWWTVFDNGFWEQTGEFGTTICSRVHAKPGAVNNQFSCRSREEFEEMYIQPWIESGDLVKADSLEELAELMAEQDDRLDAETFLAEIARYNELYELGEDLDFGKLPFRLSPIAEPPFYAILLSNSLCCTMDGIVTDEKGRALREDGTVIENLYMGGNDQGGFYGTGYPWYYGGLNIGKAITFCRVAAKDACSH